MLESNWSVQLVTMGDTHYPYYLGYDCVEGIVEALGNYRTDRFLVVTDDTVHGLHGDGLVRGLGRYAPVTVLSAPAGEAMKSQSRLCSHLERAIADGASRRSVVVAFGGGVPGNLAGLTAALLFRGIRLVHVPTTTVAAMDSVISLKQAINGSRGKNLIGTYHAPVAVYSDVRFLQTLPDSELRSGLCEATKNCLAVRPSAAHDLRQVLAGGDLASASVLMWLLQESLAAKSAVMIDDPKEQRRGLVLEYGHTVGHAIELCDQRMRGHAGVSHGHAVAIGMAVAARISAAVSGADLVSLHDELLALLDVPVRIPPGLSASDILDVVRTDNKRGYLNIAPDQAAMVLLRELGRPFGTPDCPLVAVPLDSVHDVVSELIAHAASPVGAP